MRTLLEFVLRLLLPGKGKRRAAQAPTLPAPALPDSTVRLPRMDYIDAEAIPIVRPYVLAHEARRREAQWQRTAGVSA